MFNAYRESKKLTISALRAQVKTLTAENAAKDAEISDLDADLARVTAALREMRFAYINKDGDCPHSFELEALQLAEDILGSIWRGPKEGD